MNLLEKLLAQLPPGMSCMMCVPNTLVFVIRMGGPRPKRPLPGPIVSMETKCCTVCARTKYFQKTRDQLLLRPLLPRLQRLQTPPPWLPRLQSLSTPQRRLPRFRVQPNPLQRLLPQRLRKLLRIRHARGVE